MNWIIGSIIAGLLVMLSGGGLGVTALLACERLFELAEKRDEESL